MTTLMDTSTKVTTYYFTPKLGLSEGYIQFQNLYHFGADGLYYLYAGTTNFIVGTGTQNTIGVDWTQTPGKNFGFMMVWSHSAVCRTQADNDALTFGELFPTDGQGLDLVQAQADLYRIESKTTAVAGPQKQLYFINMDLPEDEYNLTLRNFLNNVSNKGFDMFYKDWNKANYQAII